MDVVHKLLAKERKKAKAVTLEAEGVTLEAWIVRPTLGDRLKLLERAQRDGLLDKDGQHTSPLAAARLAARLITGFVYVDGVPAFNDSQEDALLDAPFFEGLAKEVGAIFAPEAGQEQARGE